MNQSISDNLIAADEAEDILQYLALGILKSRKVKLNSQPQLNVIELYKWMPDHELRSTVEGEEAKFERSPIYAMIDGSVGDTHYTFETFRLLRECFDAVEFTVEFTPPDGIAVIESDIYAIALRELCLPVRTPRATATTGSAAVEYSSEEYYYKQIQLLQSGDEVLTNLKGVLSPLNRRKYERDAAQVRGQMPDRARLDTNSVSNESLFAISVSIMANEIESTHLFWSICRDRKPNLKHPLSAIVHAWLGDWICQQDAKHITLELDKRRPIAILKQESMGSIRDLVFTRDEGGSVSSELIARPAPKEEQLTFWTPDASDSKLPGILPFELYQQGLATTKSAAVAMPVRLAFEALLQMGSGIYSERLHWQLGDLIDCLNPDGKFNWTNQVGYILDGLSALYWLRFPYIPKGEGEVDWIPFLPRAVPNQNSNRESRIIIEVSLPPDVNAHGMMVEKNIVRLLGKKSSARFNAYLTACWIFDHYGTVKGKIIDPTMPVERRNERGELVDRDGNTIFNSEGKPITNPKSADAARQLDRIINPVREKYTLLNDDDLIRACYPRGVPREQRREYLRRAKKAWTELESDGFIRIERLDSGWRIMPSEQHVSLYRALQFNRKS